jgi:hypothetical protein
MAHPPPAARRGDVRPDLSAIPEPAQRALVLGGFGLAGAALRRRGVAAWS